MARNSLSWSAAAITSLIITAAGIFTTFFPQWNFASINDRPGDFVYALFVYFGGQFFTILLSLKGLTYYLSK